jgi:hypothetical protein
MTWTTIGIIWLLSGIVSAVWHIVGDWSHHEIWESTKFEIAFETFIMIVICLVAGPIGIVIKIWETWFDPSNI